MASTEAAMAPLTELHVKLDDPVYVKPADHPNCEADTSPFFLTNIDQVCIPVPHSFGVINLASVYIVSASSIFEAFTGVQL